MTLVDFFHVLDTYSTPLITPIHTQAAEIYRVCVFDNVLQHLSVNTVIEGVRYIIEPVNCFMS